MHEPHTSNMAYHTRYFTYNSKKWQEQYKFLDRHFSFDNQLNTASVTITCGFLWISTVSIICQCFCRWQSSSSTSI